MNEQQPTSWLGRHVSPTTRRWLVGSILTLAFIGVLVGALALARHYNRQGQTVTKAQAQAWVGQMVIEYLKDHEGRWPRGWDDLRQPYEKLAKDGSPWSFEFLSSTVEVDFNADPFALAATPYRKGIPPFHVIRLRDGSIAYWGSREPNTMVLAYLQRHPPAPRPPEEPTPKVPTSPTAPPSATQPDGPMLLPLPQTQPEETIDPEG